MGRAFRSSTHKIAYASDEHPLALASAISMELRLLANLDGCNFVELDTNGKGGIFSVIPEAIGPRAQTSLGRTMKIARQSGSTDFRTNVGFASVVLAPLPETQAASPGDKPQKFAVPVGMLVINPAGVDRGLG